MFDLVIFDEASQITPCDAVGAIARGRQVVVAGDPRQMPPTSFFDKSGVTDGQDGDGEEGVDQESILDECIAARLPQRRLTWHYRSRYESLIAFSNHRYYEADLVTFPAPVTRDSAVSLRQVAGVWGRGKDRTNPIEAEAIVAEVLSRLLDPGFVDERGARLTLAVITLNAEQQRLVEDLLDQARAANAELEPYFADTSAEPVIVRNLETVQGDERDVILLGIGYGPDTPGGTAMAMNFGPLNREGGWRRLNVAITRARREMILFISFPASAIDLNRTSARAVEDLKRYIEFADRGPRVLGDVIVAAGGSTDDTSPFEQAVAHGLYERGWTTIPQVGVSRFRVHLAVLHPNRPGDYLVGIECDGENYRAAATARDRDKVRDEVLTGLGWTLLRVWSMEWWLDPHGALDRLEAALKIALEVSDATAKVQAQLVDDRTAAAARGPVVQDRDASLPTPQEFPSRVSMEAGSILDLGGDYRFTNFSDMAARLDAGQFHDPSYTPVLHDMIKRVLLAEAPIRDDLLVDRIARAHGFRRSGRQIRDRVLTLVRGMAHLEADSSQAEFIWLDASAPKKWERARYPATEDDIRLLEEIPLQELFAALKGCTSGDPISEATRRFGVRRVTSGARDRLKRAMLTQGHLDK